MTGGTTAGGYAQASSSEGSRPAPDAVSTTDGVTVSCEAPEGYTLPPSAARVILRVMKDVAAREAEARIPYRPGRMRFAFYGRVSTEDQQDPEASRGWQIRRARTLIEPHGGAIVEEYFDVGQSRSVPWKRRPEASRLLADVAIRGPKF